MKKTILLYLACLGCSWHLWASPVSTDRALKVAATIGRTFMGIEDAEWTIRQNDYAHIYAVIAPGRGFALVSKDDCVFPVVGYSASEYTTDDAPANALGWLMLRDEEIGHCISEGLSPDEDIASEWNRMEEGRLMTTTSGVEPMLTTRWGQTGFYNRMCPTSGNSYAVVGCVATAMAQVMKYWNYPTTGNSSHTDYYSNLPGADPYANFGATTYDWGNMPDRVTTSSTQAQKDAVALLCFHCGVAVDMQYGLNLSSAYTSDVPYALNHYFGYSNSSYVQKSSYSNSSWISTLKAQMDAGKPVIYSGSNSSGSNAHAFVCDGYNSNDYFHFNWGWNGSYDGYYAVTSMNPGGDQYSYYNYAVINITPSTMFRVAPSALSVQANGARAAFSVYSSSSWTASSNRSWITFSPASGSGTKSNVVATVGGNPTASPRTATITITQGNSTKTLTITQSGDTTTVQSIPFIQGFEDGIPTCWDEICEAGSHHWILQSGSSNNSPASTHSGLFNAAFVHQETGSVTKLLTPKIDLSNATLPYLTFYYANEQWSGAQNVLRVYGRNTPSASWTLLGTYSTSAAQWTKVDIPIDNPSANYQIAFEGEDNWGHDIVIDDVAVFDSAASAGATQTEVVQVGNESISTYNAPYNNYYKLSWNESRYQGSEIGKSGRITKIAYNCVSSASLAVSVRVYMGLVPNGMFSMENDWTPYSQLTLVCSKNLTIGTSTGWEELELDTPFTFSDTTKSLAVVVVKSADTYTNSLQYASTSRVNGCLYRQSDTEPAYTSHPGTYAGNFIQSRPNIRLTMETAVVIHDTVIVHDTTYVDVYIHDTTFVPVHDTTYVPVHDTTYVDVYIHDTTYIDVYIHDTTFVDVIVHDTVTEQLSWYSLSVVSSNSACGLVAGNGQFPEGAEVEIAAIPIEGSRFVQWQDGNTENPRRVSLLSDMSFIATFDVANVGVADVEMAKHTITSQRGQIIVENATGDRIRIFDEVGRCISTTNSMENTRIFNMPASGVYMVQVGNDPARKVVVVK